MSTAITMRLSILFPHPATESGRLILGKNDPFLYNLSLMPMWRNW